MNVLAEVIDESIRGMEGGLVSKAEQEKVSAWASFEAATRFLFHFVRSKKGSSAWHGPMHPPGRIEVSRTPRSL
jgi:hypothetical protein